MEKLIRKYLVGGYSTVSREDLKNAARTLSNYGLKALSWLGDKFNSVVTSGGYSDMGQTSPFSFSSGLQRRNIHTSRSKAIKKTKLKIAENSVYISPSSYIAALTQGSLNPKVGAEVLSRQAPEVLLLAAVGDIATLSKGPKLIRKTPAAADKALARTGNKNAKARVVAREIDKGVQESTKNGKIKGTDNYFNSPNNWYSIINLSKERYVPTSLKFYERRPSLISLAERQGIPRGERNNIHPFHIAYYPGYLLKGLMKGSPLERLISKKGTININQLNAYFNKASQLEREVVNKILNEKFTELKTIDYNKFKQAILNELIYYRTKPEMNYSTYGMDRLGFNPRRLPDGAGGFLEFVPGVRTNTFTFESPRIPIGNSTHYHDTTLGHSRTYTTPDEPNILHVMESQSDWAQRPSIKISIPVAQSNYERILLSITRLLQQLELSKANLEKGLAPDGYRIQYEWERRDIEDLIRHDEEILAFRKDRATRYDAILHPEKYVLENYLKQNYLQRQLQENLSYAALNKLTKMRYPTPETAAKIEGYLSTTEWVTPEGQVLDPITSVQFNPVTGNFEAPVGTIIKQVYRPEHQTILKKYADFPKLFLKLYKGLNVRTVTDAKGNTWYEVDVPKNYLNQEWLYKLGGKII